MKLLVIDMQKALMDDELYNFKGLSENVAKLIKAARESGVEVIHVQHDAGPDTGFHVGDEAFEIADEFAPAEGEKVYVKTVNSAFSNKEFAAHLEEAKDEKLMIVGLQTNYCIDATIKSAFDRGYDVYVPEETNSTFDNPYMSAKTTYEYYMNDVWPGCFAEIVTMDEAMELLKGSEI